MRPNRRLGRLLEQLDPILARIARHRAQIALVKQMLLILHRRNIAHINAGQRQRPAFFQFFQRRRHQFTRRRENDRAIDPLRHLLRILTNPGRSQLPRQLAMRLPACRHVHLISPMPRDLNHHVGR